MSDNAPAVHNDSDDDFDWEEVDIPAQPEPSLEITLKSSAPQKKDEKKRPNYYAERVRRLECHKLHTLCLLGNAYTRNKWLNDELLQARLLSLTPMAIHNSFAMIHKSRVPDPAKRGRMFQTAIQGLVDWWSQEFDISLEGHMRNRTYDEVQKALEKGGLLQPDLILDDEQLGDILDDDGEVIRSEKSLMKHGLMRRGTRDTSAQLFTALCRALDVPARLVVSLQSVPWQASAGKPRPKYDRKKNKGKGKAQSDRDGDSQAADPDADEDMEEIPIEPSTSNVQVRDSPFPGDGQRLDGSSPLSEKARGKRKADDRPPIKLRKTKTKGHVLGSAPPSSRNSPTPQSSKRSHPVYTPPVFWTEVFSRADGRWLPVDPIRAIVNKRREFDPTPWAASGPVNQFGRALSKKPLASQSLSDNRMVYVVAFEEDGYARDVTRRYAREYAAKVAKVQGGAGSGGKGQRLWWDGVMGFVTRPYRLNRDDVEDEELAAAQMQEGMPSTMSGFKDHPLYVLERHLKQNETIHPPPPDTPELGKFKGEPVYPRSSVVSLKTAENWLRSEGRTLKEGQHAIKFVKYRAGTVGRMRELEILKDELRTAGHSEGSTGADGSSEVMQGLYAYFQTTPYVPDPVVDGKVPKNNFGNVDLYVPSMLPQGAVHVPFKGVAKIARKLGLDFGEAVTGFEFKKRRAFPVVEGIVIAAEKESALLDAYWKAELEAEEKSKRKREERALKHWTKLIQGLQIRQRIQDQYAADPHNANTNKDHEVTNSENHGSPGLEQDTGHGRNDGTDGGFIVGADDVVQAFSLPKSHVPQEQDDFSDIPMPGSSSLARLGSAQKKQHASTSEGLDTEPSRDVTFHMMDVDVSDIQAVETIGAVVQSTPRTMQELAQYSASLSSSKRRKRGSKDDDPFSDSKDSGNDVTPERKRPRTRRSGNLSSSSAKQPGATDATKKPARSSARRRPRRTQDLDDESSADEVPSPPQSTILPAAPASSGRTLRPRKSKTKEQLEDERAQELAYRKVIAK